MTNIEKFNRKLKEIIEYIQYQQACGKVTNYKPIYQLLVDSYEEGKKIGFNLGIQTAIDALPEREGGVEDYTGNEEFLDEAIININKKKI